MKTIHLILILLIISCNKKLEPHTPIIVCSDISSNADSIKKYILGNWKWAESKFYNFDMHEYMYESPLNTGTEKFMNFSGDTIKLFINNRPESMSRYRIQPEGDLTGFIDDTDPVLVFYNFDTGIRQVFYRVRACKNFLDLDMYYRNDALGDHIWKKL